MYTASALARDAISAFTQTLGRQNKLPGDCLATADVLRAMIEERVSEGLIVVPYGAMNLAAALVSGIEGTFRFLQDSAARGQMADDAPRVMRRRVIGTLEAEEAAGRLVFLETQ
ncbi:MAG TPA: hypothetical protein VGD88_09655 [Opitutaceae bacterium]